MSLPCPIIVAETILRNIESKIKKVCGLCCDHDRRWPAVYRLRGLRQQAGRGRDARDAHLVQPARHVRPPRPSSASVSRVRPPQIHHAAGHGLPAPRDGGAPPGCDPFARAPRARRRTRHARPVGLPVLHQRARHGRLPRVRRRRRARARPAVAQAGAHTRARPLRRSDYVPCVPRLWL